jgi:arylsulfatase A-like enzyme
MNTDKPNVIVFLTDQQRWDTTKLHGNPLDLMPNFDRIALRGTHFANACTCQPVCAPARSSLQTGKYATETGVFKNGLPLREEETTLAKCFKAAGYQTAYIGKWHLGGVDPGFFSEQEPVPEGRRGGYEYWLAGDLVEFMSQEYNAILFDNDNKPVKLPGYRVDAYTDAAIRYIASHQQKPFFLFLSFLEPHFQNHRDDYPAPEGYRERYTGRWMPPDLAALGGTAYYQLDGYYGMIKRLDEAFGRVLDALKSLDLLEKTVVLFTSDHGCHFKTRNDEYKRSCHESSVRIPTAAIGPGFNQGGRIEHLVSLVDFAPTLLEAAGLEIPEGVQGRSMMPLIRRESVDWPDDVFIQISESQVGRAIRTKRWKYSVVAPGKDGYELPNAAHYVEEYLYDLYSDPYELRNLVGMTSHRKVADKLKERLIKRMIEAGENEPIIEPAPKVTDSGHRRVFKHEIME